MSTNGIVIVKDGDDLYCKIIAGCNGFAAPELARVLRGSGANTLQQIYDLAHFADFGCKTCLVVMNSTEAVKLFDGPIPQWLWNNYWHIPGPTGECSAVVTLAEIREAVRL